MIKYYKSDDLKRLKELQEFKISSVGDGKIYALIEKITKQILEIKDKDTKVFLLIWLYYSFSMKWYKKLTEGKK